MSNKDELNYTGLETKDNNTLVAELKTAFQDIYSTNGEILNLDSNTPDGQLIEIVSYLGTTLRELITEVYNSIDPDKCVGSVQDNRYQINYLTRKPSSFTLQNITITVNKTVELQGLDAAYNDTDASAFAVSDNNGNIWYLVDSTTLYSGVNVCEFRAKDKGAIIPVVGTITNPVTIVDGVISVINNTGATSIGVEEESDADFRIRRERSTNNISKNNIDTIEGNLLALDGVVDVNAHRNNGTTTDETGTPPHFIWLIVEGGANTEIANIIYQNLGGCGTKGSVSIPVTTASSQTININFDRETITPLYIKFDVKAIYDLGEINIEDLKDYISANLIYKIGENVETSKVTQICADAMLSDGANGYALNVEISKGGTATASTESTSISNVSIQSSLFQDAHGDNDGTFNFIYTSNGWELDGNVVETSNYGITFEGTPTEDDIITVDYTSSVWTDYLEVETIADKFTTDKNKIYITKIED